MSERWFVPLPRARVVERAAQTWLIDDAGVVRRLDGESAALARAVLDFVTVPRARAAVLAHLGELAGAPIGDASPVDELLALLCASRVLAAHDGALPEPAVPAAQRRGARVVLGLTGAVASALAPDLLGRLLARGFEVRVAMTRDARRFVKRRALAAIAHSEPVTSLWRGEATSPAPHIALAEWADVVLVCPASATTLSRIAQGDCSDVVAATCVATRAPVVLVPSMNLGMLEAPSVVRNLELLRADGFFVVRPGHGVKVAHAPAARVVGVGPGPGHDAVLDLVEVALRESRPARAPTIDWEALYRDTPLEALPWWTDTLDPDLEAALDQLGLRAGRLLDLGAGPGTSALALAARGFTVTATDVAASATAKARARDPEGRIDWRTDDVTRSSLGPDASFDVILDRGCLHVLDAADQRAWAATVTRLLRPGGALLVKTFAGSPRPAATHAFDGESLRVLLGAAFRLERATAGVFPRRAGSDEPPFAALIAVLRRN